METSQRMKDSLNHHIKKVRTALSDMTEGLSSGYCAIKDLINGLPVSISSESSSKFNNHYDEMHYFVIPYKLSEYQFALHKMRCLPASVPEVNDLPKRRVFHFSDPYSEGMLKQYLLATTQDIVRENTEGTQTSLESLADSIDALDKKLTYGMLLVGGLAAITNPIIGAGIAAKALLPGVGSIVNKYAVRPGAEKLTQYQLERSIKKAEQKIIDDFEASTTLKLINPILQELELALRTDESQHDPLIDPNLANGSIPELDDERWRELTEVAIYHVYKDIVDAPESHEPAGLGPEDIRWLTMIFNLTKKNQNC